jgi:hypothetical protein
MKAKLIFKFAAAVVSLSMALAFFAGCGEKGKSREREAADAYIALVSAGFSDGDVKLSDSAALAECIAAYYALPEKAKLYEDTVEAKAEADSVTASVLRLAKSGEQVLDAFIGLVEALGDNVSSYSGTVLDSAAFYYGDLTLAQKADPGILAAKTILDAKAAAFKSVVAALDIGGTAEVFKRYVDVITPVTYTKNTKQKLDSAWAFYNGLTDVQKRNSLISAPYNDLTLKQNDYNALAESAENNALAQAFVNLVNGIKNSFGLQSGNAIVSARAEYQKLPAGVKAFPDVDNAWKALEDLRRKYQDLTAGGEDNPLYKFSALVDKLEEDYAALADKLEEDSSDVLAEVTAFGAKIQEAKDEYEKLTEDQKAFTQAEYARIAGVEAALKVWLDLVTPEPRVIYTAYTVTGGASGDSTFSANVLAVLSVKNAFGEPIEEAIPPETVVKASVGGTDTVLTPSDGEYVYDFGPVVVNRSVYAGKYISPAVTFNIGGLTVAPIMVDVLPPQPQAKAVNLGTSDWQQPDKISATSGLKELLSPEGEESGRFDAPEGSYNGEEDYEGVVYDSAAVIPSAKPLAVFDLSLSEEQGVPPADNIIGNDLPFHATAPASGYGGAGGYLGKGWRIVSAKFNTSRVRQALAKAGKFGTRTVKVAIRLKASEAFSRGSGFIDPLNSVSQTVTISNVTGDDAGLLKFPNVLAYSPRANGQADALRFRIDGSCILYHSEVDHVRLYIYEDGVDEPIDYLMIRLNDGVFYAGSPGTAVYYYYHSQPSPPNPSSPYMVLGAGIPAYADWWYGMQGRSCMPWFLELMAKEKGLSGTYYKGKTVKYATQIIAKADSAEYRDGDISGFSVTETATNAAWF